MHNDSTITINSVGEDKQYNEQTSSDSPESDPATAQTVVSVYDFTEF